MQRTVRKAPRKSEGGELAIRSNYGLWMEQVQLRRAVEKDPMHATLDSWPHKKSSHQRKMARIQPPRFESWEGRLLSKFGQSEDVLKRFEKGMRC